MTNKIQEIKFTILGNECNISEQRARYNHYRKLFVEQADILKREYIKLYCSQNKCMNDVHQNGFDQGMEIIQKAYGTAIETLIANGIYDIDEELFFEKYMKRYFNWDEVFDLIDDRFMEIVHEREDAEAYRAERKANRGRFVGGGFGVEGAIKGSVQAGALNMASGAVHGIFNFFGDIASSIKADNAKSALFENPNTLSILANGVWENICNIHYALYDIIGDMDGEEWDIVSDEEERKATALLNNAGKAGSEEIRNKVLVESFCLDPYNLAIYEYFYLNELLNDEELSKLSTYFAVDMRGILERKYMAKIEECSLNEKELVACKDDLDMTIRQYRIDELACKNVIYKKIEDLIKNEYSEKCKELNEEELRLYKRAIINKIAEYQKEKKELLKDFKEQLQKELCTYNGVVYETEEERNQIETNDKTIKEFYQNVESLDINQLQEIYNELNEGKHSKECREIYLTRFQARINMFEINALEKDLDESKLCSINEKINAVSTMKECVFYVREQEMERLLELQLDLVGEFYAEYTKKLRQIFQTCEELTYVRIYSPENAEYKKAVRKLLLDSQVELQEEEIVLFIFDSYSNMVITNKRIFTHDRRKIKEVPLMEGVRFERGEDKSEFIFSFSENTDVKLVVTLSFKSKNQPTCLEGIVQFIQAVYYEECSQRELKWLADNEEKYIEHISELNKESIEDIYFKWIKYSSKNRNAAAVIAVVERYLTEIYEQEMQPLCEHLDEKTVEEIREIKKKAEKDCRINTLCKEYELLCQLLLSKEEEILVKLLPQDAKNCSRKELERLICEVDGKGFDDELTQKYKNSLYDLLIERECIDAEIIVNYAQGICNAAGCAKFFHFSDSEKRKKLLKEVFKKSEVEDGVIIGTLGLNSTEATLLYTRKIKAPAFSIYYYDIVKIDVKKKLFGNAIYIKLKNGEEKQLPMKAAVDEMTTVAVTLEKIVGFCNQDIESQEHKVYSQEESRNSYVDEDNSIILEQNVSKTDGVKDKSDCKQLIYEELIRLQLNQPSESFDVKGYSSKFDKKIQNAMKNYVSLTDDEAILLYDSTLFETGKDGLVFSDKYMYFSCLSVIQWKKDLAEIKGFYIEKKSIYVKFSDGQFAEIIPSNIGKGAIDRRCEFLNNTLKIILGNNEE